MNEAEKIMPYIDPERRPRYDPAIEHLSQEIENGGDLQYVIAELADKLLEHMGTEGDSVELRYSHCEKVYGLLNGAAAEFYRIVQGPYEDLAIEKNGHCYKYARERLFLQNPKTTEAQKTGYAETQNQLGRRGYDF